MAGEQAGKQGEDEPDWETELSARSRDGWNSVKEFTASSCSGGLELLLDAWIHIVQFSFGTVEEEVEMGEILTRNSELEAVLGAGTAGAPRFQIAAGEVEKAVEEALMQEVERKQPETGSGGPGFPGTSNSGGSLGWGPQASSHVQNVF